MSSLSTDPFVLYSTKWSKGIAIWWGPKSAGYTDNLDAAGDYTEIEARSLEAVSHGDALAIRRSDLDALKIRRILDIGDGNNWKDFEQIKAKNRP